MENIPLLICCILFFVCTRSALVDVKTQIFLPDGKVQILVSDDEIVEISVNVQHVLNADMQRLN